LSTGTFSASGLGAADGALFALPDAAALSLLLLSHALVVSTLRATAMSVRFTRRGFGCHGWRVKKHAPTLDWQVSPGQGFSDLETPLATLEPPAPWRGAQGGGEASALRL